MTDLNNSRILTKQPSRVNGASISFDSTYIQIDKFKEYATARKNHAVSLDQRIPAKRTSNNLFIIFHKKSRNQK